jgi:tetratricopeptide (TPR) repeat protein
MPIGALPRFPHRIGIITLVLSTLSIGFFASAQSTVEVLRKTSEVRSALKTERAKIAADPKDAALYIDLAYTLMDAGVADEAIEQGRTATQVDPHSALAFSAYAWLLHHNSIGVNYGKGYNYEDSLAAYRHAIELNPDDLSIRQSLSDSLRFDLDGLEYGPTAHLNLAIDALRYIQAHQRPVTPDVANNLVINLFRANRYPEVNQEADRYARSPTPVLDGAYLAATAITVSPLAALALVERLTDDRKRRSVALDYAAEALWTVRRYPQAATLLEANQEEHRGDVTLLRKIQMFRSLQPYQNAADSGSDPLAPVRELIVAGLDGTLSQASLHHLFSSHAHPTDRDRQINDSDLRALAGMRQTLTQQTGLPPAVVVDIAMGNLRIKAEPETREGQAKVDAQILGSASHFFLVEEDHRYRIVATSGELSPIGEEALYLANHDKLEEAGELLNWKREFSQVSPDDPLGGMLFAHLWSAGQKLSAESIRLAAASLMTDSVSAAAMLPELVAAREKAKGSQQGFLTLLIASIALEQKNAIQANIETKVLLNQYPDSLTAIRLCGRAFSLNQNWAEWQTMLASRLAAKPRSPELLREFAAEQVAHGEYTEARRTYRSLMDGGHGIPSDENEYAWISLFASNADSDATRAAESAAGGKDPSYAALHTLACIYAVQGRAADARETLYRAMAAAHQVEADGEIWLGFGLLYEQYGEKYAAATAYKRVGESPTGSQHRADSSALAQLHLKHIGQASKN